MVPLGPRQRAAWGLCPSSRERVQQIGAVISFRSSRQRSRFLDLSPLPFLPGQPSNDAAPWTIGPRQLKACCVAPAPATSAHTHTHMIITVPRRLISAYKSQSDRVEPSNDFQTSLLCSSGLSVQPTHLQHTNSPHSRLRFLCPLPSRFSFLSPFYLCPIFNLLIYSDRSFPPRAYLGVSLEIRSLPRNEATNLIVLPTHDSSEPSLRLRYPGHHQLILPILRVSPLAGRPPSQRPRS